MSTMKWSDGIEKQQMQDEFKRCFDAMIKAEEKAKSLELLAESYRAKLVEVHRLVRNNYTCDSSVRDQVMHSIQEIVGDER